MIYVFKMYFDILSETGIPVNDPLSGDEIEIEPIEFTRIAINTETEFDEERLAGIINKIEQFYNQKFHLSTVEAKLDTIIK